MTMTEEGWKRFIEMKELAPMLGVHPQTIDAWELAGKFPARIRWSPSRFSWDRAQVERWIAQHHDEADRKQAEAITA